ncbi:MAG: hypothetical protein DRJ42_01250 [Deltaproteobacteria bacterium]|nr:MAG: hypothetical protein DRJ42_01250 [Deltaproteobacteria bacterium]
MFRRSGVLRRVEAPVALAVAAACLMVASLVPLTVLAAEVFSGGALRVLGDTLGEARTWALLMRSLGLSIAVTLGALAIGLPTGAVLGRTDVIGRRAAFLVLAFPVFLPPFLLAFGWFQLFGTQGLVGSAWTSGVLFGPAGLIATLALAFAPIVTAFTALGISGIDPSLEEAARAVSRPHRTLTRILLPLAWPSIALGALIVFALTLSEIGAPMFLRVRTYPAAVLSRLGGIGYAPGEAVALVLPLLAVGLVLVFIDRRLIGRRSFASLGVRSRQLTPMALGRARKPVSAAVWLLALVSLLPLGALAGQAGASGMADALDWIGPSMGTSLAASALAAGVITLVGVVVGHALARRRRGALALDALVLLTFIMPASVLGVGMVAAWNRPGTQFVYTTLAVLVLGLVARYGILGVRALDAVFHQSSPHYEEAAAAFGAGFFRRMARVVLPMHGRGVFAAWLIAFVFCMRDLDAVVVFYPPGLEPLPVRIFTLEANGPGPVVAALSVYHALLTAAVLAAGGLVLGLHGARNTKS